MALTPTSGPSVRIAPAPLSSLPAHHRLVARLAGAATGGEPPHVFTTLARHRRLFRRWLPFGGTLLLHPLLPRRDVELVVLRTAWSCGSWYVWVQHVGLARRVGLPDDVVARVPLGASTAGWTPRQRMLLEATDQLVEDHLVTDDVWSRLASQLDERQLIELCLLVGHYAMLAMALNSLGVEPELTALSRLPESSAAWAQQLRDRLVRLRTTVSG